jgi:hypothetical protein
MVLQEIGGGGYDYVQNTTPSGPDIGESWLDTSVDPPVGKVYADVGSGGSWLQTESDSTISENLDAKVSSAGASEYQGRTIVDFTETFREPDVTLDSGGPVIKNDSLQLLFNPRTVDDFESNDLTVEPPEWSNWTGDTYNFTAQSNTVINGNYSGELTANDSFIKVTTTRSPPIAPNNVQMTLRADADVGARGDWRLRLRGENAYIGSLKFNDRGNVNWQGNEVLPSWSTNTNYDIQIDFDFSTDQVTININGTDEGTYAFDSSNSKLESIILYNITQNTGATRNIYVDDIKIDTKSTSGSALIQWPHPGHVSKWDKVWADLVPDGETATIDIQKSPDGGSTWNNHDTGFTSFPVDISNIDNDKLVRIQVNLSRTDVSNNPRCEFLQRRWLK